MTAVDYPWLVRGVALVAASQKNMDPEVRRWNAIASDPTRPDAERLKYLRLVFFAPGHDPRIWLTGFRPDVMIYDTSKPAVYPNGRALADDVVLSACVLGGECRVFNAEMRPMTPRSNDLPFLSAFPYLAPPHPAP